VLGSAYVSVCALLSVRFNVCSLFFFFSSRRRHTRLVSDWSSDVCSSDLPPRALARPERVPAGPKGQFVAYAVGGEDTGDQPRGRSEERRVGKECRARGSPYH